MAERRGKDFEALIREAFNRVPDTAVIRLQDPVKGYLGVRNICDFLIYHYPHQYFIECKTVHGNIFPFHNITRNQWSGLYDQSQLNGVVAGIICWWIDQDVTRFFFIDDLHKIAESGKNSIRYDFDDIPHIDIPGRKKRVFFDYDMLGFFEEAAHEERNRRANK